MPPECQYISDTKQRKCTCRKDRAVEGHGPTRTAGNSMLPAATAKPAHSALFALSPYLIAYAIKRRVIMQYLVILCNTRKIFAISVSIKEMDTP